MELKQAAARIALVFLLSFSLCGRGLLAQQALPAAPLSTAVPVPPSATQPSTEAAVSDGPSRDFVPGRGGLPHSEAGTLSPAPGSGPEPVASSDAGDEDDDKFSFEGALRTDALLEKTPGSKGKYRDNVRVQDSYITLNVPLSDKIKFVLTTFYDTDLRTAGRGVNPNFDVNTFINECYVEIHNIGGQAFAVLIGKQQIAFGQGEEQMPLFSYNPLDTINHVYGVMGLTVRLDQDLVKIFDEVEASVFSSTEDAQFFSRGEIGKIDSASVRITKSLWQNLHRSLQGEVSYAYMGHKDGSKLGAEHRGSVGLVYTDSDKNWITWVEVTPTSNSEFGRQTHVSITGGTSKQWGPGQVVLETTWIQDAFTQLGVGYILHVSKHLNIEPDIRYTFQSNAETGISKGFSLGTRAEIPLGDLAEQQAQQPLLFDHPEPSSKSTASGGS